MTVRHIRGYAGSAYTVVGDHETPDTLPAALRPLFDTVAVEGAVQISVRWPGNKEDILRRQDAAGIEAENVLPGMVYHEESSRLTPQGFAAIIGRGRVEGNRTVWGEGEQPCDKTGGTQ